MIYLREGYKIANEILKWARSDKKHRTCFMLPAGRMDSRFLSLRRTSIMKAARSKKVVVWGDPENVVLFRAELDREGVPYEKNG